MSYILSILQTSDWIAMAIGIAVLGGLILGLGCGHSDRKQLRRQITELAAARDARGRFAKREAK